MDYKIIIYIVFGVLPSLVWLFYYLRKDVHPEPKRMIIRMFLWGALITIPVFFVQLGMTTMLNGFEINVVLKNLIYWILVIALSEELFKYIVVRVKALGSLHLDEPLDIMLYMVVVALGFAALENILYLLAPVGTISLDQLMGRTLIVAFIRFVGATFLHTLCSAVIGYFMAISSCEVKFKKTFIVVGITIAVLLHGLYDFSIMTLEGYTKLAVPAIIIITLAFMVFAGFEKLKKLKGVCKIEKQ